MTSLKEAALSYAKKGWAVFPVRADKKPYTTNGVMDATTNLYEIEAWWDKWPAANIAMDVGRADMMVLDLDPGHSMEDLEKNVGELRDTHLSSKTPRGGRHLFFSIGVDEIVKPSASKLAPHVDVRSFNSYVLLPPSKTKDGVYEWIGEGKPAYRTDELFRLSNSGREKHEDRDEWIIEPDLDENVAPAIKWLREKAKIAVEGEGGDAMAYATAAHLKSFGISKELALELMWEHWNPRCSPPWTADSADHFEQKVENGYAYNTSPPGNITSAYSGARTSALFEPVVSDSGSGHEWKAGRFRLVDRAGMQNIKPPAWLIEGFLPENSYCILFGAPGTFKTFLALDVALSIATGFGMGANACWPRIVTPGPVLFAAGEGRPSISNRVRAWEKMHFVENEVPQFILCDPVPMISEDFESFIKGALDASPEGYKLVVIDTVGRAMQGMNENTQEHASAFTKMVEKIQRELGATVLALHHTGHNETGRARGSSVFGADADTIIKLDRRDKDYVVSLSMMKQKDAQEWEKKKYIRLNEVHLTLETKSLVAIKATENEYPKGDKYHPTEGDQEEVMSTLNEVVIETLEQDKSKKWSNNAMAEAVAKDARIKIGSSQLRQKHLKELGEDSSQPASQYYNLETGMWCYGDN